MGKGGPVKKFPEERKVPAMRRREPNLPPSMLAACLFTAWIFLTPSCSRGEPEVLGKFVKPASILHVQEVEQRAEELIAGDPVVVAGQVSEVCPTAGCWLVLQDGSKSLRAELLGFSVRSEHKNRRCQLQGKLVRKAGNLVLLAKGARFDS
jgi:hypothetical protein